MSLIGKIMTEDPPPLATLRPDAPAGLTAVIDRALAKDRDARYASCHDLQADLEALQVSLGQTITAARISDFARAYAEPVAIPDETTGPALRALEAEMNGTGPVRPVPASRPPPPGREPGTRVPPPPPPRDRRGFAWGVAAFLAVAVVGGAGGYGLVLRRVERPAEAIPIERAAPVEPPPPGPKEEIAQPPEKPKPAETEAPPPAPAEPAAKAPAPVSPETPAPVAPQVVPPPAAPSASPQAPPPIAEATAPAPLPAKPRQRKPPQIVAESPVVTAKGELVLLIRPWARVEVDGQEVGVTPLNEPLSLAAGEHRVRLVNPDLGKDITRTVRIAASERSVLKELLDE